MVDYLLVEKRGRKADIRSFFCYTNLFVSGIAMLGIITMKCMLHFSG